jgi:nitroimidazol reductase NimA-like FMN-containing flavoprotein (pyridoxamine 5'-phosphate oxidase superfamily)
MDGAEDGLDGKAIASEVLARNRYMTLATSDEEGRPWATPVWFATEYEHELYWVSDPDARHSRNLAVRPELAVVIFDSTVEPGSAAALYLSCTGAEVSEDELERGIEVFGRASLDQGLKPWTREDVTTPARHRLYRAAVVERFVLGPGDERLPVAG